MERIVTEARVSWEQVRNPGTAWPRGTSAAGRQREATASASASKSRPVCRTVVPRRATWTCSTPHATCSEEPGTQRARFSLRSPGSPRGGMSCALRARTSPSANRLSQTLPGSGVPFRPRRGSIVRGSTASPEAPQSGRTCAAGAGRCPGWAGRGGHPGTPANLLGHLPRVDARHELGVVERARAALEVEACELAALEAHTAVETRLIVQVREEAFFRASRRFVGGSSGGGVCEAGKGEQQGGRKVMRTGHAVQTISATLGCAPDE